VGEIGEELGFDADIFRDFSTYFALAEYYQIKKRSLRGLAKLLDTKWHGPSVSVTASTLHRSIVELEFSRIYTTNFDRWLERAFEHWKHEYHKIVKVSDIVDSRNGVTDIVKFHGDFDDPDSLVLLNRTISTGLSSKVRSTLCCEPTPSVARFFSDFAPYLLIKRRRAEARRTFRHPAGPRGAACALIRRECLLALPVGRSRRR
jgi:hypothetical protein